MEAIPTMSVRRWIPHLCIGIAVLLVGPLWHLVYWLFWGTVGNAPLPAEVPHHLQHSESWSVGVLATQVLLVLVAIPEIRRQRAK